MKSWLLPVVLLAGCGSAADGVHALREGRDGDAHRILSAAVKEEGDAAGPTLLFNAALAATREGRVDEAARLVARAHESARGPLVVACADLAAHVAWERSLLAEQRAAAPDSDPALLDEAVLRTEEALYHWKAVAAAVRRDRAEVRRNAERAVLRLEDLRSRGRNSRKVGRNGPGAPPAPVPAPSSTDSSKKPPRVRPRAVPVVPPNSGEPPPTDPGAPVTRELPGDRVLGLLESLGAMEREKRAVRRSRRKERTRSVERDW
ncbi:MAG: hypothetical protein ACYTG4_02955 [Planctomycetota bacterium]|jgi:hypothetical protein